MSSYKVDTSSISGSVVEVTFEGINEFDRVCVCHKLCMFVGVGFPSGISQFLNLFVYGLLDVFIRH